MENGPDDKGHKCAVEMVALGAKHVGSHENDWREKGGVCVWGSKAYRWFRCAAMSSR
jgi:hypothetical protein